MLVLRTGANTASTGPLSPGDGCLFCKEQRLAGLSKMFIPGHRFEIFSLTPSDVYKKNVLLSACGFQPFTPEKQRHRWVQHGLICTVCRCHSVFKSLCHFLITVSSSLNAPSVPQSWTCQTRKKCYFIEKWTASEHPPAVKSGMVVLGKEMYEKGHPHWTLPWHSEWNWYIGYWPLKLS